MANRDRSPADGQYWRGLTHPSQPGALLNRIAGELIHPSNAGAGQERGPLGPLCGEEAGRRQRQRLVSPDRQISRVPTTEESADPVAGRFCNAVSHSKKYKRTGFNR